MTIKLNTIITLETSERYMVLNETIYENDKYYLVMGIDAKGDVIESKAAIFKEIYEGLDLYVEKISDPKLILELTNILKTQL